MSYETVKAETKCTWSSMFLSLNKFYMMKFSIISHLAIFTAKYKKPVVITNDKNK
jgi:hypothetical protein